jgi:predicted esterase
MSITEHHFQTQRTARYQLIGSTGPEVDHLFFALHGYGHLSKYFARMFEGLDSVKTLVVVPEGLHRFYLDKEEHKRVGASWMTREDRLNDIADLVLFLDGLHEAMLNECPNVKRLSILGFSQGTATATRWAVKGKIDTNDLILWAGWFPPDLEQRELEILKKINLIVALGDQDEYITEEMFTDNIEKLLEVGLNPQLIRFNGMHEIPRTALLELRKSLRI